MHSATSRNARRRLTVPWVLASQQMQSLRLPDVASPISRTLHVDHTVRSILRIASGRRRPSTRAANPEGVRLQLAQQFPNTLLLQGQQLPSLHSSRHFVNLTNGLELAPLLVRLQLPFSVVRIRSTHLEQQSFEALLLELDANLLLALALGHSCIIWDCGCRNRHNGAPRAIWYGLEFVRYALNRSWLGRRTPAHLRGNNVTDTFETACRKFQPSTKKRLRYYKRYLADTVQQHGVALYGLFKRTEHDEHVDHFVEKAVECCGLGKEEAQPAHVSPSSSYSHVTDGIPASAAHQQPEGTGFQEFQAALDAQTYETLVCHGLGMFAAGLSHTELRELQQGQPGVWQQQQVPAPRAQTCLPQQSERT